MLYDIQEEAAYNFQQGPFFKGKVPVRPHVTVKHKFLNFELNSRIGVPACAITLGKGIALLSKLGFDVLTYKTIRSHFHPAHVFPNLVYINTDQKNITMANSFGINSESEHFLKEDIHFAKSSLSSGQILIVSVYGEGNTFSEVISEFCKTAIWAKEAGADIIEVNLSCPNIFSSQSPYLESDQIREICQAISKVLYTTPFIIKTGIYTEFLQMKECLIAAAKSGASGICGINAVKKKIVNKAGEPFFGKKREYAGVSGSSIKPLALEFISSANKINHQEKLELKILGTGGITEPSHFDEFFESGADIALSAVGTMHDPYLAYRYHTGENP